MSVRPIAAALIAARAFAAAPAVAPPLQLTLEEALALGDQRSPIVRRARLERAVVAARRAGAAQVFPANPWLSLYAGGRRDASGVVPPAQGFEMGVHLEQSFEIGGQRGARLDEVARAVAVADARERLARGEVRARVRGAYLGLLIATAQAESLRQREALGRRLYESARARVQAGAASEVELNLAAVESGRLTSDRIEADLAVAAAAVELRALLALAPEAAIVPTTPLAPPPPPGQPLAALLAEARARRADLEALARTHDQLDATLLRLRREAVPSPTLFLDYASQQPGQRFVGGGLGVALPIWRRNQGELAVAHAEQARVDGERAFATVEAEAEVARAWRGALARGEGLAQWEREVVPAADANVELLTQGWRSGKYDLFRVIQASREAGEARQRRLQLLGEAWQAAIDLDRATGAR